MKVAISYTTKNKRKLRRETLPRVTMNPAYDLHIVDGSDDVWRPAPNGLKYYTFHSNVRGGADAGLAFCLSMMLNHKANYTHVGITEMDVLLGEGWFEATMALFDRGSADGLVVGAVSARSYVDRVLIQRDGYAACHNLGAGNIIFTREAAEIVLRTFRTTWWPDNVKLFAQLSGIDLRTYAAFLGREHFISTDWGWEAQLARRGLAALALTPAKCQMIGQVPPLAEQGLELTTAATIALHKYSNASKHDEEAFEKYRTNLKLLRTSAALERPQMIHREGAAQMFFPHQVRAIMGTAWRGNLELMWRQGAGPFLYRAGPGGASLVVRISGTSSFLCSGGVAGAQVTIEDTRSGFKSSPILQPAEDPVAFQVPGGPISRLVTMDMAEGAVFHGLLTDAPQMLDTMWRFDWSQLPEAK